MTSAAPDRSAVADIERLRAVTMVVVRVGAVVLCGAIELLGDGRWLLIWPLPALLGVLALTGTAVCVLCATRGELPGVALRGLDLALVVVALPLIGWYAGDRVTNGWPGIVLPYALLTAIMIGVSFRTVAAAAAWTVALGGALTLGYLLAGHVWWAALPHVAGLAANAFMASYVTRVLMRNARALEVARAAELERSAQLSRERERGRTARLLHDRVLQTLEALVRDSWIPDQEVRARVAAESQWLRAYLRGDDRETGGDALAALEEAVRSAVAEGLQVEFNAGRLRSAPERGRIPADIVEALAGVLREALTNVRKHAGVPHAVVRAEYRSGTVTLSVLDHGIGFDPGARTAGLGIARSIVERARAAGGRAEVESVQGEGTHVTVRIPLPPEV
ncbi:ATP-binding protein [Nonomuraea sp. NPDC005650]|uniref:sensor histidine kinase n=1 Tax=Nonomuraea sp. NPDC005650 TaxID=3157045 RepID=UPI00339F2FA1